MARKTDTLQANDVTNYSTWMWPGVTNVIMHNIGPQQCPVSVQCGFASEMYNLDPGERRQIGRVFAGLQLYVKNEGDQVGEHILEVTVY